MTIPKHLLTTSVRITAEFEDFSDPQIKTRQTVGTGFLVDVPSEIEGRQDHRYLLTAAHVVEDKHLTEYQAFSTVGDAQTPRPVSNWLYPIDGLDLAVAEVPIQSSAFGFSISAKEIKPVAVAPVYAFPLRIFYPTDVVQDLHLGAPIYFVGWLAPLDRMMVRSGTLGLIDAENVLHDCGDYVCHLVDCRSYDGFSGSPCFYVIEYSSLTPSEIAATHMPYAGPVGAPVNHFAFVGMFTEHLSDRQPALTVSRYGVGVMLRSEDIRAALLSDILIAQRSQRDGSS
jgi:hypothetical protein